MTTKRLDTIYNAYNNPFPDGFRRDVTEGSVIAVRDPRSPELWEWVRVTSVHKHGNWYLVQGTNGVGGTVSVSTTRRDQPHHPDYLQ